MLAIFSEFFVRSLPFGRNKIISLLSTLSDVLLTFELLTLNRD